MGAFAFIPGEDPTYKVIEGAWTDDDQPYGTIHCLGSLKSSYGVAAACFEWCWGQIQNLRIDTHEDNAIMRYYIEKAGFRYCGIIHLLISKLIQKEGTIGRLSKLVQKEGTIDRLSKLV